MLKWKQPAIFEIRIEPWTINGDFSFLPLDEQGSSLLASILNDAGADFDGLDQTSWDRAGGAFEHPG